MERHYEKQIKTGKNQRLGFFSNAIQMLH